MYIWLSLLADDPGKISQNFLCVPTTRAAESFYVPGSTKKSFPHSKLRIFQIPRVAPEEAMGSGTRKDLGDPVWIDSSQ